MATRLPGPSHSCRTCRAEWTQGRWTWGCEECGGAAMEHSCELCLGRCGAMWRRAVMDSNDLHRSHFVGGCARPGDLREKATRWAQLQRAGRELKPPLLQLRAELIDWSSDRAWAERPAGPPLLQVLGDGLKERGHECAPRPLAHSLFSWEPPDGRSLPRLPLHGYWHSAGTLVLLEPLALPPRPTQPRPTRLVKVVRVVADGYSWLNGEKLDELPVASKGELVPGRRYLGLVLPTNMVPGMLLERALEVPPEQEAALVDWHRHLVSQGEHEELD